MHKTSLAKRIGTCVLTAALVMTNTNMTSFIAEEPVTEAITEEDTSRALEEEAERAAEAERLAAESEAARIAEEERAAAESEAARIAAESEAKRAAEESEAERAVAESEAARLAAEAETAAGSGEGGEDTKKAETEAAPSRDNEQKADGVETGEVPVTPEPETDTEAEEEVLTYSGIYGEGEDAIPYTVEARNEGGSFYPAGMTLSMVSYAEFTRDMKKEEKDTFDKAVNALAVSSYMEGNKDALWRFFASDYPEFSEKVSIEDILAKAEEMAGEDTLKIGEGILLFPRFTDKDGKEAHPGMQEYTLTFTDKDAVSKMLKGDLFPSFFGLKGTEKISRYKDSDISISEDKTMYRLSGATKNDILVLYVPNDYMETAASVLVPEMEKELESSSETDTEESEEDTADDTENGPNEADAERAAEGEEAFEAVTEEDPDAQMEDALESVTEEDSETENELETETETGTGVETEVETEAETEEETEAVTEEFSEQPETEEEDKEELLGAEYEDLTLLPLVEVEEEPKAKLLRGSNLTLTTKAAMKGVSAPPIQDPVTEDGMTIEKITIKWLSKSTGSAVAAGYDRLELSPITDDVANQQWQMDFALSGKHEHEAGTIEIVIPAYIWKNRDGAEPGILTLAVPEDPATGADFSWKRSGDYIVFTNTKNLSAATKVMIQGTFREVIAHDMVDIDVSDGTGDYPKSDYYDSAQYHGVSDKLSATITLVTPNGSELSMTSNEIDAQVTTYVQAAAATKTAYNPTSKTYNTYIDKDKALANGKIPAALIPADADEKEYTYVKWYVSGQAQGNQPFTMTLTDTPADELGCKLLGIQVGENVYANDGDLTQTVELFNGYNEAPKTAYVWTCYDRSLMEGELTIETVHNSQTISVTGWDDKITTTKSADAEVSIALPIEYEVVKEWDDNDNEYGLRPDHQTIRIYRNPQGDNIRTIWKYVRLVENPTPAQREQGYGTWSYRWSDEGDALHYETEEVYMSSGKLEDWYDSEGNKHTRSWGYHLKESHYDPDLRQWRYVNTLRWAGYDGDFADMYKRVWWQYDDPYLRSTRDRALNLLMNGHDAIIPYDVWGIAGSIDAYMDNVRAGSIDAHRVDVTLEDYLDMINVQRISTEDADLAYADIFYPDIYGYTQAVKDPSLPEDDPERYYDPPRYTLARYINDYTDAEFEAYVNGQWIKVGELHGSTLTAENGASVGTTSANSRGWSPVGRLNLPEGTQQFRETVSTFGVATELKYVIGVEVHPTEFVLEQIGNAAKLSDYMMMTLDNFARMYANDNGTRSSWTLEDWDRGYMHGRLFRVAAWQDKEFRVTANQPEKRSIRVHTKATSTMQSNVLYRSDYDLAVAEGDIPFVTCGTWYDLLPPGMVPDLSTVKLQNGDTIKDAYVIENYKDSGRTLLVVEADLGKHVTYQYESSNQPFPTDNTYPKEGYKQTQVIEFDCDYSWEDAKTYGLDAVRNTIAFETDDDEIGNLDAWRGETDDPTSGGNHLTEEEVRTDLDLMKDLDSKRDDPAFIYAGADLVSDEIDFAAETSIRKWVQAENTGIWSYGHNNEAVVYEGGKYTYRINLTADSDTTTTNIIMLDSLENYVPTSDKDDYGDSQWRGYFRSLNINPLIEKGIAPVVYYSTVPGLDISKEGGYNPSDAQGAIADILENAVDEHGNRVWSTTLPDDPSTVTAYAIDCRKAADGSDFELIDGDELHFYVYMRAPALSAAEAAWGSGKDAPEDLTQVDITNPDHNAHAYNNVYLDATQVDGIGRETHAYIHWDYVKVGIVPFNIRVTKQWNDDDNRDGKRTGSVTVNMFQDGNTYKTVTLDESNDWTAEFEHVLRYDFDTKEPDYDGLDDGHYFSYTFDEEEVPDYEMQYSRSGEDVIVVNTHIPEKTSVPFTKTWEGEDEQHSSRPESITVRLNANGVFTGRKVVVRPDEDGNWYGEFTDLFKYENGQEIEYTVEEEPVEDYIVQYGPDHGIINTFYPYGDLTVEKQLVDATDAAKEILFDFTITLTTQDGLEVTDTYPYEIKTVPEEGESEVVDTGQAGNGSIIQLKGNQKLYIHDLPSHVVYQVKEARKAGFRNTLATGDTGVITSGQTQEAVFENTYSSRGSAELLATKMLSGRDIAKNQFRFEVKNEEGETLRVSANKADGSVSLGTFRYTNLDDGKEYTYHISEMDLGKDGYTYSSAEYIAKVYPHDNGEGSITCDILYYPGDAQVFDETTRLEASSVYVFPDRFEMEQGVYDALEQEEKDTLLAAHQANDWEAENPPVEPALSEETYIFGDGFTMAQSEYEALSQEERDALVLEHQSPDWSDTNEYVQPVLKALQPSVFRNEYHAHGELTLRAWKQLKGRALTEGEFTFTLMDEEGNVLQTKTNETDGSIVFDALEYDEGDVGKTFFYGLREVPGNDATVEYDTSVFGYKVIAYDNGDGTLSFSQVPADPVMGEVECPVCSGHADSHVRLLRSTIGSNFMTVMNMSYYNNQIAYAPDTDKLDEQDSDGYGRLAYVGSDMEMKEELSGYLQNLGVDMSGVNLENVGFYSDMYPIYDGDTLRDREILLGYFCLNCNGTGVVEDITGWSTGEGQLPVFTNTLKPGSLTITKLTQWHEGDTPDPTQKFHFKIKLINTDGYPIEDQTITYIPTLVENIGEVPEGD